jgi:hypothetical protein
MTATKTATADLEKALRARYGEKRFKIHAEGAIEVLGANGKWRKVGRVGGRLPGRPADMTKGKKVTLYLDAETFRAAEALGNGNLSLGVRRAFRQL